MGVFEPRKGQAGAVAAVHELAAVHPDLRLALVGAVRGHYTDCVTEQVRRSGLAKQVHTVDITPDIYTWYGVSDLFLCPADLESLPRSVLEAMAFELPVVSTDVFGLTDLIHEEQTGWLTQARDLESLVGALHRVLRRDRSTWAAVGAAARRHVEAHHGVEAYAAAFGRALRALIADPHADLAAAFHPPVDTAPARERLA
jgi:glycosyltransferase involved in cell wall biosynthesis